MDFTITGNIVDIDAKEIFYGTIEVSDTKISSINKLSPHKDGVPFIMPGFIDAHVHIESSMLVPSEFARLAVVHGTVATISDPHEIANVCGVKGVEYMIDNSKQVPFKFYFGAPSCVPATDFETAGATLDAKDVDALLDRDDINYLSEMMNFPGVLHHNEEVEAKIMSAKIYGKPVDGHAPGLRGNDAKNYIEAGISTDHECFTKEEALEKLNFGMKIIVREGSAARNFDALIDLLNDHEDAMMFCSDDKHPDSLVKGHINELCKRAIEKNIDVFKILKAACANPVKHYNMKVGLLKPSENADFVIVKDLKNFQVLKTFIDGMLVAEDGQSKLETVKASLINNFNCSKKNKEDFICKKNTASTITVIEALDGQLITNKFLAQPKISSDSYISDIENDMLKIAVVNRYKNAPVAIGFVRNFGLKKGAIASSVAHDSHNIIAVGVSDDEICKAVNLIIEHKGGVSCTGDGKEMILPLPVGGLMSNESGYAIAEMYTAIDKAAKSLGSKLSAPFMTLSFMALLVIPHVKLSDLGLFDGDAFDFYR